MDLFYAHHSPNLMTVLSICPCAATAIISKSIIQYNRFIKI